MESEDQSMLKYAIEDLERIKDCEKQTSMLLQDLGHLTSYLNFPIPREDSIINFSIIDKNDTMGLINIHFYCEKITDPNLITIKLGKDLSRSKGTQDKLLLAMYNGIKDWLSPEEQRRDSIRLSSREEQEFTEIAINKNLYFQKYDE